MNILIPKKKRQVCEYIDLSDTAKMKELDDMGFVFQKRKLPIKLP